MSLLIKALDKAQAEKAQAKNALKNASLKDANNKENTSALQQASNSAISHEASLTEIAHPVKVAKEDAAEPGETSVKPAPQNNPQPASLSLSPLEKPAERTAALSVSALPQAVSAKAVLPEKHKNQATGQVVNSAGSAQKAVLATQQEHAANVFYAKRNVDQSQNIKLAVAATLAMIALSGFALYYYLALKPGETAGFIPPNETFSAFKPLQNNAPENPSSVLPASAIEADSALAIAAQANHQAETTETTTLVNKPAKPKSKSLSDMEEAKLLPPRDASNSIEKIKQSGGEGRRDKQLGEQLGEQLAATSVNIRRSSAIASESASIAVTQNKAERGVNPVLLRAYQAYNAGNDVEANQLYKQVLQREGMNVDAMLGLGAIAMRQNRAADASDWYHKVLEIEPRNSFAQAALLQVQANGPQAPTESLADESALKTMLANAPNDANLYANLGNLYARQRQWPAAQQAYFDAYRLNATADNAFNLAISLDQLGKPDLALPYYRQALNLATTQSNGIDLNALTARIQAIASTQK